MNLYKNKKHIHRKYSFLILIGILSMIVLSSCSTHLGVSQQNSLDNTASFDQKILPSIEASVEPVPGVSLNTKFTSRKIIEDYKYQEFTLGLSLHPFNIRLNDNLFITPFLGYNGGAYDVTKKETITRNRTQTLSCPFGSTCYTSDGGIILGGTSKTYDLGTKTETNTRTINTGGFRSYNAGFYITPRIHKGESHFSFLFRVSRELNKPTGLIYNNQSVDLGGMNYTLGVGFGIGRKDLKRKRK